jgi:hypothetical protein
MECYEGRVKSRLEELSKSNFPSGKPVCPYCSRATMFKKCDIRNTHEASTIRQLTSKPELANLKALETTKFNLIQNKKHSDFLTKKTEFLEKVIDYFIRKYSIMNLEFPSEIRKEDQFNFIESLYNRHRTFSLDQLKVNQNLISNSNFSQLEENSVKDYKPYKQAELPKQVESLEFNRNNVLVQGENRNRPVAHLQSNQISNPQERNFKNNLIEPENKSLQYSSDNSTKNIMGFHLQNVKQPSYRRESSHQRNKHKLQTLLLETSNFTTPIVNKKSGNYFMMKKI